MKVQDTIVYKKEHQMARNDNIEEGRPVMFIEHEQQSFLRDLD